MCVEAANECTQIGALYSLTSTSLPAQRQRHSDECRAQSAQHHMAKHTRECSFVRSRSLCLRIVAVMGRRYCPPLHGNSKSFLLRHLLTNSFTRTYTYHGHWRSALGTHGSAALDNFVEWSRSRTVL